MPIGELYDDEDWYDDPDADDDPDDDEMSPCPECGEPVSAITGKCPGCGYWLTDNDRRVGRAGVGKPLWMRATVAIVIIALLAGVLVEIAIRLF